MDKNIKIGLICFENPFAKPSNGGKKSILSRVLSFGLIKNVQVDIYLFNQKSEIVLDSNEITNRYPQIKNVYQYNIKKSFGVFFGKFPICNNKRYISNCVKELKKHFYDFIVYEGEQIAKYRFKKVTNSSFHIIYMHDIESNYREELSKAQTSWLLKKLQKRESKKFKYIEKNINALFDDVWFVSNDEFLLFNSNLSKNKGRYMPLPAVDTINCLPNVHNKNNNILYVGDLGLKNNIISIKWFINNVFPNIKSNCPQAELTIIGRINSEDKKSIETEGVTFLGYVEDLEKYYRECSCFVSPVVCGAGVKVKTIDALSRGLIVVSTTKGIEGTLLKNNNHLIVEDDPILQAKIICDILNNREKYVKIASNGHSYISKNHSIEHQATIIQESFNYLNKK